jgi:hypothetical protein
VAGPPLRSNRGAAFGIPTAIGSSETAQWPTAPVATASVDAALARPASQGPPPDPVNDLLTKRSDLRDREPAATGASRTPWQGSSASRFADDLTDKLGGALGTSPGGRFCSDHLFDGFISPMTNPFLFEDPRSLTEIRPIVLFQKIPSGQPDFHGGGITFFGTQARVAFTDQWSLVINKFGFTSVNSNSPSPYHDGTGFSEIWLGPKWTFYRGQETGTLAAAGLQLQLPIGSKNEFQDTGTLSLVPYASFGQNFLRDFSLGSFNFLANTGFSFSTNKERSDYYYLSAHLDFDVGNLHRFYPLVELNWFLNATNGNSTPIGVEGRDLINFGGAAAGSGLMTGAFGGRYKINETAQLGAAFEFPLAGRTDLFRYRFTIDFILRF